MSPRYTQGPKFEDTHKELGSYLVHPSYKSVILGKALTMQRSSPSPSGSLKSHILFYHLCVMLFIGVWSGFNDSFHSTEHGPMMQKPHLRFSSKSSLPIAMLSRSCVLSQIIILEYKSLC